MYRRCRLFHLPSLCFRPLQHGRGRLNFFKYVVDTFCVGTLFLESLVPVTVLFYVHAGWKIGTVTDVFVRGIFLSPGSEDVRTWLLEIDVAYLCCSGFVP
jgi:hypothetical protein